MSEAKVIETPSLNQSEPRLRKEFYGRNEHSPFPTSEPVMSTTAPVAVPVVAPVAAPVTALPSSEPKAAKPKPTHYKVVCISLYTQDIENLEAKVAELKRRGHTKANKSQLIRQALRMLDIDKLPPPQQ